MAFSVKMLCGMTVFGVVTAANMAAGETQAQMNPGIADLDAILTNIFSGSSNFDLFKVLAFFRHEEPIRLRDSLALFPKPGGPTCPD